MVNLNNLVVKKSDIENMFDTSWFNYCKVFDDLLIVTNKSTSCFILKTADGLVLIDAILPHEEVFKAVVASIKDVGWDPKDIRHFVISHGHFDHTGCGKWIREAYSPKTYMSKIDDRFWEECPAMPQIEWTLKDFDVEHFIDDGDVINCGDHKIRVFFTPGHTPGGLSFIFEVHDKGEKHMVGLWGGSNPPADLTEIAKYLRSLDYFYEACHSFHCDVALNAHPFSDNGLIRLQYARERLTNMPNAYILSENEFRHYFQMYRDISYERLDLLAQGNQNTLPTT